MVKDTFVDNSSVIIVFSVYVCDNASQVLTLNEVFQLLTWENITVSMATQCVPGIDLITVSQVLTSAIAKHCC